MSDQADLLALMDADPIHASDKEAVVCAVREAARLNHGLITRDDVRPHVPEWVFHKTVGSTIAGLVASRVLTWTGAWRSSNDTASRNAGKGAKVYSVDLTASVFSAGSRGL